MTNTDRTGNPINEFGVPTGPIESDPTAVYHADGTFKGADSQEVILRDALMRAGVELGTHDERIVEWFARFGDWSTFATVVSWIERARRTEDELRPGGTLRPVAPGQYRVFAEMYAADFDNEDDETPRHVWSITERAVTEIPADKWTTRLLATLSKHKR
ncbi:hypothetical protein [Nocardiopsis oceani]